MAKASEKQKNIYYIHFDSIDSTNTWTKENAHLLDPTQVTCITAQEQTLGRGRNLRKWLSPKGENIYATIYFCLPRSFPWLPNLGQILSLSCARILKEKGFFPKIKWPNDLLLEGKKVAGILCEVVTFDDRLGIVLGVGINVNMSEELLKTIDQPATSLAQLSGRTWHVEQILEPILQQFLKDLELLKNQGFPPFQQLYEDFLAFKGEQVSFNDGIEKIYGTCDSIDINGKLRLTLPSGERAAFTAGEIKFKKSGTN